MLLDWFSFLFVSSPNERERRVEPAWNLQFGNQPGAVAGTRAANHLIKVRVQIHILFQHSLPRDC